MQRSSTYNNSRALTIREKAGKWLNHCTGSDRDFKEFWNERGAGTLEDMALRAFVWGRRGLVMEGTSMVDSLVANTYISDVDAADAAAAEPHASNPSASVPHASDLPLSGLGDLEWGIGKRILGVLMKK